MPKWDLGLEACDKFQYELGDSQEWVGKVSWAGKPHQKSPELTTREGLGQTPWGPENREERQCAEWGRELRAEGGR